MLPIAEKAKESNIVVVQDNRQASENAQQYGVIVDVGPDAWRGYRFVDENGKYVNGKSWCEVGDMVAIDRYSGKKTCDPADGSTKTIINDQDILCVIMEAGNFDPENLPELLYTKDGVAFNE